MQANAKTALPLLLLTSPVAADSLSAAASSAWQLLACA